MTEEDPLFKTMEASREFKCGKGASPEEIDAAQEALGLEFPWEYRALLAKYSYVLWFGNYVTGITDDKTLSVVKHTLSAREAGRCPKTALILDTDYKMFCKDPDDIMIIGTAGRYRDFRSWLKYKLS